MYTSGFAPLALIIPRSVPDYDDIIDVTFGKKISPAPFESRIIESSKKASAALR
jgi:hypothetical protein